MMVALGSAIMVLGAVIEVLDLSVCALASMLVVFIYLEIGSYYPWLVWICTSLATALIYPGSIIWAEYLLVFGIYPLIKAYIEKMPRWTWLIVKLLYVNAVIWGMFCIAEFLLQLPFFGDEGRVMAIITYVLMNIAFILYDYFIVVMVKFYYEKLRPRFKRFLK